MMMAAAAAAYEDDLKLAFDQRLICSQDQSELVRKFGAIAPVTTTTLLARIKSCEAPQFPALARAARIEGSVTIAVVVERSGQVGCVRTVKGHPLLVASAMMAATKWTLQPDKTARGPSAMSGQLLFHFSTSRPRRSESCTDARW